MSRSIPLAQIRTTLEALSTQVREGTNEETVEEYARGMHSGDVFPPVDLVADGKGRYYIADGWHRVLAARLARCKAIPARLLPPIEGHTPRTAAIRYALRANCAHGLRLTRGDQRNKARRAILEVPGMVSLSDRKLAAEVGVSQPTVSRARNELVRERRIPHGLTGELAHPCMPAEYASTRIAAGAFGVGYPIKDAPERFRQALAYMEQLKARDPIAWHVEDGGEIHHAGLMPDYSAVAFVIDGNPIVDGLPTTYRVLDDDEAPRRKPTEEEQLVYARIAARREFDAAKRRLEARGRGDLTTAIRTLTKYRDVPELWKDIQALALAGGPPEEHEPDNPDF